jgi:hypothetical protein
MPLPKPYKREEKSHFISRCMSNKNIQNDFETQDQKIAVCYSLFKHKQAKADYSVETESDTYLYTITPEDEGENPLDDKTEKPDLPISSDIPPKTPDKWPSEAPNALDDTKASDFIKPSDYENSDQSHPPASFPSLHSPGLNPNPDNSKNFHVKSDGDWERPTIKDMKWFLAIISDEYYISDPDIEKMKEWYVGEIDKMSDDQFDAKWPLSFDKIEKKFDRPNKTDTPETRLKDKQSKENQDINKIAEKDKPFAI